MKMLLVGFVAGFLLGSIGLSGTSKLIDKGVESVKMQAKEYTNE